MPAPPEPRTFLFEDAGSVPNNPHCPALFWPGALDPATPDLAGAMEALFERNGWPPAWRWGIYTYEHCHTNGHEVLGVAKGRARIRLGGRTGEVLLLQAGDVVAIPAGVGHENLDGNAGFLVVGAYPPGTDVDLVRDATGDAAARERIIRVPVPDSDPVTGGQGPLTRLWASTASGS